MLRRQSLDALKQQRLSLGQQKEAAIIGKIATKEMRKADWLKLRNIFNPKQKSGISNIEIPDKDDQVNPTSDPDKAFTWKRIYDPTQVEAHILEQNVKHFGQAEGTLELFEYDGTSSQTTDLLEGNLDVNMILVTTESARTLLQTLGKKDKLASIENYISLQEFTKAFATWNESTSMSPSGRHLGHYKCLLRSEHLDDLYDEFNTDPREKSSEYIMIY
jgi:hypothetical protein